MYKYRQDRMKYFWIAALVALYGCAVSYNRIDPDKITYSSFAEKDSIEFWYRYDVLNMSGNRRYDKKADKLGIQVVAVKITNNTNRNLNFSRDLRISTHWGSLMPLDAEYVSSQVKQPVLPYLLYSLLYYYEQECQGTNCETTTFIPFGIAISGGNIAMAISANKNFAKNMVENNLLITDIAPGETKYGLIALRDSNFQPLEITIADRY